MLSSLNVDFLICLNYLNNLLEITYYEANQKSMKSKFSAFFNVYETSTNQNPRDTMRDSKVIRLKKSKIIISPNFVNNSFFYLFIDILSYNNRYLHDFASLVEVMTQYWIFVTSEVITLFYPLLDDWKYVW